MICNHDALQDHSVWNSGPSHHAPYDSQGLDVLCRALIMNDPNVTSFSTKRLPVPFAQKLGRALCGDSGSSSQRSNNTVVSEIRLDSNGRDPANEDREEHFERWLTTSPTLHSVKVCFGQPGEFRWIYSILQSNRTRRLGAID